MGVCPTCGCDKEGFIEEIKRLQQRERETMKLNTIKEGDLLITSYKLICDCHNTHEFATQSPSRACGMAVAAGWAKIRGVIYCPECKNVAYDRLNRQ